MNITTGIDVGSTTVKCIVVGSDAGREGEVLGQRVDRIRRRDPVAVVNEGHATLLQECGVNPDEVDYVATTGYGDWVSFRTGHFYGLTTHARGAIELEPEARGALDVGGLHARAILMDERSKVLGYRMTSQCASDPGGPAHPPRLDLRRGAGRGALWTQPYAPTTPRKMRIICAGRGPSSTPRRSTGPQPGDPGWRSVGRGWLPVDSRTATSSFGTPLFPAIAGRDRTARFTHRWSPSSCRHMPPMRRPL